MLKYLIVPISKDQNKRVSDRGNYRPICMPNVFTKIVQKYCIAECKVLYKLHVINLGSNLNMRHNCVYLC